MENPVPADADPPAAAIAASALASAKPKVKKAKKASTKPNAKKASKETSIRQQLQSQEQRDVARVQCTRRTEEAEANLASSGVMIPRFNDVSINYNDAEASVEDKIQQVRHANFGYLDWKTFEGNNENQQRLACNIHLYDHNLDFKQTKKYKTDTLYCKANKFVYSPGWFSLDKQGVIWYIQCTKCSFFAKSETECAKTIPSLLAQHAGYCAGGPYSWKSTRDAEHDVFAVLANIRLQLMPNERKKLDREKNKFGIGIKSMMSLEPYFGRYRGNPRMKLEEFIKVTASIGIDGNHPVLRRLLDDKECEKMYNTFCHLVRTKSYRTESALMQKFLANMWAFSK
jgi:hypothetical protein